jgi:glycosyltransferase involved in cell wall biosynthesis
MRLAWFSPMPPVRSGVAAVSAELVTRLDDEHDIEVFVDEPVARTGGRGRSAHDFVWRHRQQPFDLTVYQLGNSSHHDYIWPYLFRYPGLTMLHDGHLHHARAASLLRQRRAEDYRAEFAANEPDVPVDAAELAIAGLDSQLLYQWPFVRLVVQASRLTAIHSPRMRDELAAMRPDAHVEHVRLGHGIDLGEAGAAARRRQARERFGLATNGDEVVFGCFGGLTPDKRLPQVLDAFEALLPYAPSARLILAGAPARHYDVVADVQRRALGSRALVTGYLDDPEDLIDAIYASDATLNLRWPTAREMSGPWLQCLAAGKPTVIIDLAHTSDTPALDPRTWRSNAADGAAPIAIAIDILDEDHSLRLAMRRLANDAALRETLGASAREYWRREHTPAAMLDDYRRAIAKAASLPAPAAPLPPHLADAGTTRMETILGAFGVAVPWNN